MNETNDKTVVTRRDIQYDKLTPGQRKIALEIQQKYAKRRREKEAQIRPMIIKLQKSLMRGDINIEKFKLENKKLGISPENIEINVATVRRLLKEYFSIDMDKERI